MKKLLFLMLLIFSCSALFSCGLVDFITHECEYGEWRVTTEATCTSEGQRIRNCTVCGSPDKEKIAKLEHKPIAVSETPSTCTVAGVSEGIVCSVCDTVISGCTPLPLDSHIPCAIPGRAPTCTAAGVSEGEMCFVCEKILKLGDQIPKLAHTEQVIPATDKRTEGKKCSVCDTVLVKPTWIIDSNIESVDKYDGDWGYGYLASLDNGDDLTAFYLRMDEVCDAYHNFDIEADTDLVFAKLTFSDLGLTKDEALMVWSCYRNDRPLYYWMSPRIQYTTEQLWLMTDENYSSEEVRDYYNELVFMRVADFAQLIAGSDSEYDIALILHDEIILASEYAYEPDGVTPEDSSEAHNILGILVLDRGVCESYARSYQLLLNYFGVENIFVTGYSKGVPHAWNMIRMDDGEYYWFDMTWDDQPSHTWGVSYGYFCVSDTEAVDWYDGGDESTVFDGARFLDNHTVDGQEMGVNFLYTLPEAADAPFTSSDAIIRDTVFEKDGFTYAVSGYREVQVTGTSLSGEITIPESVEYLGETYAVTSVGKMKDGIFIVNFITENAVTDIYVPKSIKYIFLGAFNIATLENIVVDEENEYYFDKNGVLYSYDDLLEPEWIPNTRN